LKYTGPEKLISDTKMALLQYPWQYVNDWIPCFSCTAFARVCCFKHIIKLILYPRDWRIRGFPWGQRSFERHCFVT